MFLQCTLPSWYGTNHYPNEAAFLGAQNGTRFLSGKPTFGKFNFLTSVFKTSMSCMGTGTLHAHEMPRCLGRTETYWLHDVQWRRAGQVVSTSTATHPLRSKDNTRAYTRTQFLKRQMCHRNITLCPKHCSQSTAMSSIRCITVTATQTSAALLPTLLRTMAQNHGSMYP